MKEIPGSSFCRDIHHDSHDAIEASTCRIRRLEMDDDVSLLVSKSNWLEERKTPTSKLSIRDRYLPYRATRSTPNRSHVSHSSNKTGKWNFANFQLVRAKSLQSRRRPTKTKENDRTCFVHLLLKESLRKHHSKESLQTAPQLECKGTKEGTEWKRQR